MLRGFWEVRLRDLLGRLDPSYARVEAVTDRSKRQGYERDVRSARAALLAWSACGLILLMIASFAALSVPNRYPFGPLSIVLVPETIAALVGGLVASRQPRNPVGWIVLGHAFFFTLGEFSRQYAIYGLITEPGSLPLAGGMASPAYWAWFPGLMLALSFLPLYFPDGGLASYRWRPVAWLAVLATALLTATAVVRPGTGETRGVPNPLGVEALGADGSLFAAVDVVVPAIWLALAGASVASLVVRFRRSRGEERQQVKWFVFAMVLVVLLTVVNQVLFRTLGMAGSALLGASTFTVPWVAIAVSVLRHRLYDIDLVINRALVYGSLTAALVLSYLGGVVLLQALFRTLTGQESQLAVVASTLAIAAMFRPLRGAAQALVDRRFYRRRYDATKTLDAFSERLREETDLDGLLEDLAGVVRETVQPEHVSLWLHPEKAPEGAPKD